MTKRFLLGFILFISFVITNAQDISVSPYSAFGYGEKRFSYGASSYGMGGLSTAYLSPFGTEMNFLNPAANMNLYYTSFAFEGQLNSSNFDNGSQDFSRSTAFISRIALAFPVGKNKQSRLGFGFQPYSAIGYKTSSYSSFEEASTVNKFEGDGGLNSLHAAYSYNFNSSFSLGARVNYLFGNLDKEQIYSVDQVQLTSSYKNNNRINGITFGAGAFFKQKIGENHQFAAGASYTFGSKVRSDQDYVLSTYQLNPQDDYQPVNIDTIDSKFGNTKIKMPQEISLGVSYGKDLKWNIGAQVDWEQNSEFYLPNSDQTNLQDRFRTAVGGYLIPKFNSPRSYFARMTYRAGGFYEQTPVVLNDKGVDKYGITFGFGFPVGKANDPSQIDLGIELGNRGTVKENLVRENYANFKLSFTLNDNWFRKRVYD